MNSLLSIAWITHGASSTLLRSISTFLSEADRHGRSFGCTVFDSSPSSTWKNDPAFQSAVTLRDSDWKEIWLSRLERQAREADLDPSLIRFATLGEQTLSGSWITTGANRNTALLNHVGQSFLFADDDVFLSGIGKNSGACAFNPDSDPFETSYFRSLKELLEFQALRKRADLDFFGLHEEALAAEAKTGGPVPISVSGISGDSGAASPRLLFSLPHERIVELAQTPGLLGDAMSNRLIHRQVSALTLSPHPLVMTPCVALNNELPLPPFFPIGRNQDGAFGYLLKAIFPNALIGHVPASIEHRPDPPRSYPKNILDEMPLRFNDLLILLVVEYLRGHSRNNSSSANSRYDRLGNYFIECSRIESQDFLGFARKVYLQALDHRSAEIARLIDRCSNVSAPGMSKWLEAARAELDVAVRIKNLESFGVPVECNTIDQAQKWLSLFGNLLKIWPEVRRICR